MRLLQVYQVGISYADSIEQIDVISFIDVLRSKYSRLVCVVFAGELVIEALQGHRASRKVIILGTDPI